MDVLTLKFKDSKHQVTRGVEVNPDPKPHVVIDDLNNRQVDVDEKLYKGLAMGMGPCPRNGEFVVGHKVNGVDTCPECKAPMTEDRKTSKPLDGTVMGITLYDHHLQHDQVPAKFRLTEARPVMINHKPCLIAVTEPERAKRIIVFIEADDGVERHGMQLGLQIDVKSADPKFKKFNATATATSGFKRRAVVLGAKDHITVSYESDKGWEGAKLVVGPDMKIKLRRLPTRLFKK